MILIDKKDSIPIVKWVLQNLEVLKYREEGKEREDFIFENILLRFNDYIFNSKNISINERRTFQIVFP